MADNIPKPNGTLARRTPLSIGILITTSNRASLRDTLLSVKYQEPRQGDLIYLACDGVFSDVSALWDEWKIGVNAEVVLWQREGQPRGDWGHSLRNEVLASGVFNTEGVMHLDDDDILAPHAFRTIRGAMADAPGSHFLFRMQYANGFVLWEEAQVVKCNVGTPMLVHPPRETYPTFNNHRLGDFDFISAMVTEEEVCFRPEVTALIRPERIDWEAYR